jgi:hypothetical protein
LFDDGVQLTDDAKTQEFDGINLLFSLASSVEIHSTNGQQPTVYVTHKLDFTKIGEELYQDMHSQNQRECWS